MTLFKRNPDKIGALTSILCLIHCLATPFLFMIWSTSTSLSHNEPSWWYLLDYAFLLVSFIAIYEATKKTKNKWIRFSFWTNWFFLATIIINEKFALIAVNEIVIYIPTICIIGLHMYNLIKIQSININLNTVTAKH